LMSALSTSSIFLQVTATLQSPATCIQMWRQENKAQNKTRWETGKDNQRRKRKREKVQPNDQEPNIS